MDGIQGVQLTGRLPAEIVLFNKHRLSCVCVRACALALKDLSAMMTYFIHIVDVLCSLLAFI